MEEKKFQSIQMEVKYSDFKVINPDFTRCRCNVFYTGRNRNYSDITPDALNKLISRKGYANIPVIGHIRDNKVMGGHDRKIEITDEGIDIINQCVPYGVIPEDCNPAMDKIIDIHGEEKEYFSVDVILWTSYFPEIMETIGDPNVLFSQSMEINILDYSYDGDYTVINDFALQALCLLGRYNDSERKDQSTEPCFEDSTVHRFSIDETQFKQNFELMLEKLKSYESGDKSVQDNNNNFEKEEKTVMDKAKIMEALAAFTYENAVGETVARYAVIDFAENKVGLIDRQDNKAYSVNVVETEDQIVFDFDNAVECSFTIKDKAEEDFDYAGEIATAIKANEKDFSEEVATRMQKEMETFNAQIEEMTKAYNELKAQYDVASEKLAQYEAADEKRKAEQHEAEVEAIYEKFAKKINRVPEFLCYRADRKNIEKDTETIEAELTVIAGKAAMNKAQTFSYVPTTSGVKEIKESNELAYTDRYGDLFAKFIK